MNKRIEEIKDTIDSLYGADCAYFGVDGLGIASALYEAGYRKPSQPVIRASDDSGFEFEYGIVHVHQRNVIHGEEKKIDRGIRMDFVKKVKCVSGIAFWEVQIVYKDEEGKLHCDCMNLDEWRIEIKHQGNMQITM